MAKFDVVYLLAKSAWNEEIRYSLRSFERHFPDLGQVWIAGYLPPYLDPNAVRHVPEPEMARPGVFVESIARRRLNDDLPGLSEDYLVSDDDHYCLRDVTIDDFDPLWIEDLSQLPNRGTGAWQLMLWRTFDLLVHMGYPAHNYESHTPTVLNRARYAEVADRFVNIERAALHRFHGVCTITAYWNIVGVPGGRRWAREHRVGFTDKSANADEEMISRQLRNRTFLFHNDRGLNAPLKTVIAQLFPDKSRFEL